MLEFKAFIITFLSLYFSLATSQVLENLEVIWEKSVPLEKKMVFGVSISCAGDVNGDGFDDVIIGARPDSLGEPYRGKAYIFFGGNPMDTVPDVIFIGETPEDLYGLAVSTCGDINVDGYSDVMVGAPDAAYWSGKVFIYHGGVEMDTAADMVLTGPSLGQLGSALAHLGNVNGDGYDDFGIAARSYNEVKGRVYIYFGGPDLDTIANAILEGGHEGDHEGFGCSVGGGGDVNGDGFDDILVGADVWGPSFWGEGRIYVYYGGNPMDAIADVWMDGEGPNQSLGWRNVSYTYGGNMDVYADVVAGTPFWPWGFPYWGPGKVYILFGGIDMDGVPDVSMIGRTDTSGLGVWSSGSSEIKDGYDGVLAGAPIEYNDSGTAYLWLGGTPMDTIPDAWMRGERSVKGPGWKVTPAGDVDGDGVDEMIISNYAGYPRTVWICKYGWGIGVIENLEARGGDSLVVLGWDPEPTPRTSGYEILRSTSQDTSSWIKLNEQPIHPDSSGFVDREVENGITYYYWIRILSRSGFSKICGPVEVMPLDLIISSFTLTEGAGRYVWVDWHTSQEPDFLGWNIYRCEDCDYPNPEHRRNPALISPGAFDYHWSDCGTEDGKTYLYRLGAVDLLGEERLFGPEEITTVSFDLGQNAPNPFEKSTTIQYQLSEKGYTTLRMYDCVGRIVRVLVAKEKGRGRYVAMWDGKDYRGREVSSGVYYYRLEQGSSSATRKMILMR